MASRVMERLSTARRQRFVGRDGERALFQDALAATELPLQVLHVFGPGGVGKTTLLREFARLAQDTIIPAFHLDARNLEPLPESSLAALQSAMELEPLASTLQILSSLSTRPVILIDKYETLAPLDPWLREKFLPQLTVKTQSNTNSQGERITR